MNHKFLVHRTYYDFAQLHSYEAGILRRIQGEHLSMLYKALLQLLGVSCVEPSI